MGVLVFATRNNVPRLSGFDFIMYIADNVCMYWGPGHERVYLHADLAPESGFES